MNARLVIAIAVLVAATGRAQSPAPRFDRSRWQADYASLKTELERSYSHLAWFGSPESGANLPVLDRATREALRRSQSDTQALDAIRHFVAGFHDGHFSVSLAAAVAQPSLQEPPIIDSAASAATACAAFGFAPVTRVAFSLPFESLPGVELVADGLADAFRTAILERDGMRVAMIRIPRFRPAEFPSVCERAWKTLRLDHKEPTRSAVNAIVESEWLRALAERLTALRARGVAALVVDIGGNGGGNDLGDWAVRLFTRANVHSAPLLLSDGPVAIPYFDEQLHDLRTALASAPRLEAPARDYVQQVIAAFERRKEESSDRSCDMSWVWREQRGWATMPCRRLIESGFASGALAYSESADLPRAVAGALYWASRADAFRGAWDGPTYVLTNSSTGSAAEMFAALIRDRGIAKTVGAKTFGLGCGFLDYERPFVLAPSKLVFNIPNCVRLRVDGTDDVAGVAPDIPVTAADGESARSLAWRTLGAIMNDRAAPRR
jgi:hypothetical protein